MVEKETLKRPVLGITGVVIAATGLIIIFFYASSSPIAPLIMPYLSYFFAAYALIGIIAIVGVPIIVSYRYDLIWAGWTLMALLIVSIVALILNPISTFYGWFFIFLFWPASLFLYAIVSGIETATKRP